MGVNNISNHINGKINGSEPTDGNQKPSEISLSKSKNGVSDMVSIGNFSSGKNEVLFAKLELEKLNQTSFEELKTMKSKISEYQAAKEVSEQAANETEIGKLLNNPDVWGEIASKILD